MTVKIIVGHALQRLRELLDKSVQAWITSPPYWGLRDYSTEPLVWGGDAGCEHVWGDEIIAAARDSNRGSMEWTTGGNPATKIKGEKPSQGQFCQLCGAWLGSLGLEPTPDLFIQHLVEIFREARRTLRDDGVLWVNLGDSYAGSGDRSNGGKGFEHGQGKQSKSPDVEVGLKPKDLVGIPWRTALALQADGWYLRSACPHVKRNSMPESCEDRPTTSHEYWFLFAKSGDTQFWTHREKQGTRTKPQPDYRWIHAHGEELMEEPGGNWKRQKAACPDCGGSGSIGVEAFGKEFVSTPCGRCKGKGKVKAWQRVNLWKGHDYFWDGEAVRENYATIDSRTARGITAMKYNGKGADLSRNDLDKDWKGQPHSGRNRRTSDFFFESLDAVIADYERYLAHLKDIRENGGMLLDENGDPLGLNVPTRGFKGAHFATFAPELIEPLIKASTGEKGCCPECGAAWVRVVEKERHFESGSGKAGNRPNGKYKEWEGTGLIGNDLRMGPTLSTSTIGWFPTCNCSSHAPIPCTVGDMFGGAGTVGLVADRLGRDALLIELNPDYAEMARRRIAEDAGPMLLDLEVIEESAILDAQQLEMFA